MRCPILISLCNHIFKFRVRASTTRFVCLSDLGNFSDRLKMAILSNLKGTKGIKKAILTVNELFLISLPYYCRQQIKKNYQEK